MKIKSPLVLIAASFLVGVSFVFAGQVHAAAYSASNLLGQMDENNEPFWTSGSSGGSTPTAQGFNLPSAVAIDEEHHRLFIGDAATRVLVFNLDTNNNLIDRTADYVLGQANVKVAVSATSQSGMKNAIWGLAYDPVYDRLFVSDRLSNRVLVFDTSVLSNGMNASYVLGQANFTNSGSATSQNGLSQPAGLAYSTSTERLFVADYGNSRVLVFNVAPGTIANGMNASYVLGQAGFASPGAPYSSSTLTSVSGIAYDTLNDRLFALDEGNRLMVFNVASGTIANGMAASHILGQGTFTSAGAATTTQNGFNVSTNIGLAYDAATGNLFVADKGNNRVMVFEAATGTISDGMNASYVLGQANFTSAVATTTQSGLNVPVGLAYNNSTGYLFVAEQSNYRVTAFDVAPGTIANGMNASDAVGQIEGANTPVYTVKGKYNGTNSAYSLSYPSAIALDPVRHRLFVDDAGGPRVLVYNLDSSNNLLDRLPDNVLGRSAFRINDTAVPVLGQSSLAGSYYSGLDYDTVNDRLFVTDSDNNRVLVFDTSVISNGMNASYVLGQANFTSAVATTTQSGLKSPAGIAYDSDNNRLFVADSTNNRVLVFDTSVISNGMNASYVLGQANFTSAVATTTINGMRYLSHLVYDDANDRLFVAEQGSQRVTVFDVAPGTIANGMNASYVLGQTGFTTKTMGTSSSTFSYVSDLAYDPDNDLLFVGDDENNRVLVFEVASGSVSNGKAATAVIGQLNFISSDSGTSQTAMTLNNDINGLAYDPDNNRLYVSEASNNRISIFDLARITDASVESPELGAPYSYALTSTSTQGTATYSLSSGSLPSGLSLASDTGVISGELSDSSTVGTYNFAIRITDTISDIGSFASDHDFTMSVSELPDSVAGGGDGSSGVIRPSRSAAPTSTLSGASPESMSAQLSALLAQLRALIAQAEERGLTVSAGAKLLAGLGLPSGSFTRDLTLGSEGDDVKALQAFLNSHGFPVAATGPGSPGQESIFFGKLTQAALAKFQQANGIVPAVGYFGPKTRAFIEGL